MDEGTSGIRSVEWAQEIPRNTSGEENRQAKVEGNTQMKRKREGERAKQNGGNIHV